MLTMRQIGGDEIVFKKHIQNLEENGGGAMTIEETKYLKTELQKYLKAMLEEFQKKTGITVEEINISHNGGLADDQVLVDVKTYL